MNCLNCGIEFDPKRSDAKYCSPNCKLQAFRKTSIETDNVTLSTPRETDNFRFTVKYNRKPSDVGYDTATAEARKKVREATYWYDVPLGAIPVKQKGWPDMPEDMNGRQYFLWWKNNFEIGESGEPVILNPFPTYENVRVELGGEGARRWGA